MAQLFIIIKTNRHGTMSRSGLNWFNFSAEGHNSMGPHNQFKNKKPFPEELLTIPFIHDIFYNPRQVFYTLKRFETE